MKELKIEVFGRVQGVRFRHFVKETADNFQVRGYVMNKDDGSVLIIAQGEEKILKKFLDKVQKGPTLSKVEGISYFWKDPEMNYKDFIIALDRGMIEDQTRNFINLGKRFLNIKRAVPEHIAIIPDGNRRWAQEQGFLPSYGHKISGSYENIKSLIKEAENLGVKYLTFWGFSTENWKRTQGEKDVIFKLILDDIKRFKKDSEQDKIKFRHLGRIDRLPKQLLKEIDSLEKATENNDGINVQLCIDYGGRDEITRAINKILKSGVQEIKEEDIKNYLDSADIPDPDFIIRTSGEKRTSGLMPFQSAYAELYFADVHFPDFSGEELRKAVDEFARRGRRFGK